MLTGSYVHRVYYPVGTFRLSLWVRWLGLQMDYGPVTGIKAGDEWSCTSTSPYTFMLLCLIMQIYCFMVYPF